MPGIFELYRLSNTSAPIKLTVKIGQAGKGETTVRIDGIKQNGTFTDSFVFEPGLNTTLHGKKLEVHSYVGKIIPSHPYTSVAVTLEGGTEKKEYLMEDRSTDNPVIFRATFTLLM